MCEIVCCQSWSITWPVSGWQLDIASARPKSICIYSYMCVFFFCLLLLLRCCWQIEGARGALPELVFSRTHSRNQQQEFQLKCTWVNNKKYKWIYIFALRGGNALRYRFHLIGNVDGKQETMCVGYMVLHVWCDKLCIFWVFFEYVRLEYSLLLNLNNKIQFICQFLSRNYFSQHKIIAKST